MFFATAVALAFASCTSELDGPAVDQNLASNNDAIGFGVYNAATSRATNVDENVVAEKGFGVFAYSTDQKAIKDYLNTDYMPNFMFNQKVTRPTGSTIWEYSPIKYWPNNLDALVSFYGYAPYIPEFNDDQYINTPDNNNILSNVKYVDPYNVRLQFGKDWFGPGIEYKVPDDPTSGIDLLWGQEKGSDVAPVNKPKPAVDEKIQFVFKHALSRLHFNIQVWPDEVSKADVSTAQPLAEGTSIKIEKVELVGKIAKAGTLRLYDGSWNVESGNYEDVVFEGNKLNPVVDSIYAGLAADEIDLLKGTSMSGGVQLPDDQIDNFVMLIPNSKFFIRITYTVTTKDPLNPKNTSVVTNVINSTDIKGDKHVTITNLSGMENAMNPTDGYVTLEAGKAYDFHLNIGLTSVKFEAEVTPWVLTGSEIDLPNNYEGPAVP